MREVTDPLFLEEQEVIISQCLQGSLASPSDKNGIKLEILNKEKLWFETRDD
jgi:hypothetical protein